MADEDQPSWWFATPPSPSSPERASAPPGVRARADHELDASVPPRTAQAQDASAGPPPLPAISLPKGGGAIIGIGEKLTIGPSGTARLTVPVFTPPARQGFTPALELGYDSGAGNGPFGIGWNLLVPSVTRKTSLGLPRYADADDSDMFILSGAEDLIPRLNLSGNDWTLDQFPMTTATGTSTVRRYRPRVESEFARIERWREDATGDVHWRTVTKANVTSTYGQDAASRIADPADPSRVFSWLLDLSYDDRGNAIQYLYKAEDADGVPAVASEAGRTVSANRYLKHIFYGNDTPYLPAQNPVLPTQWCFRVVVDYGEHNLDTPTPIEDTTWPCRPDPFSVYRAGFEIRCYRACRRILMFHQFPELTPDAQPVMVRSTDLGYLTGGDPALPVYAQLGSVTQTGWVRSATAKTGYLTAQLPPVEFGYAPLAVDGSLLTAEPSDIGGLPGDFDGTRRRWADLDGEGLQGILTEDDGAWYYRHNVSAIAPAARFTAAEPVAAKPNPLSRATQMQLTDLNGDGHLSAVSFAPPVAGWYERDDRGGWTPLRYMTATASVDWSSPDLRFIDLNGDGLADVLVTEDDAFTWYEWQVFEGFGPPGTVPRPFDEDHGPALVFGDGTGTIFLADMSGDGLTDLVRIRASEVCYWPNRGYGRFDAKITMDSAPVFDFPDRFDPRRLRLGDVDGSGTADILYAGPDGARLWFNQSGNSWSAGHELPELPNAGGGAAVSLFDLLGTGTACAVWTSPLPADAAEPIRYIDLTGGVKPYLLTAVSNNFGASSTLSYAPSTKFYLQDRRAGDPWVTRLPFPVHVVERVDTTEAISRTSLVSLYSYHHGFYDGIEREFRGFARVDQLDAESVPAQSGIGTFTSTPPMSDGDFTLPPVRTRTWYHTGAYFGYADIAARLRDEYYALDRLAPELGATVLPAGASSDECRQACRALRGRVLRQEVYADDGSDLSVHPYTVTEHRYQTRLVQPERGTAYAGVYAYELESITCQYERDPADPRVGHTLTLKVDDYGNVTKSAAASYPRRAASAVGFSEQAATLVSYHEADVATVDDQPGWYRAGIPVETRGYELTGVPPDPETGRYDAATLLTQAVAAPVIPYEQVPDGTSAQRRLVERARTLYRSNDLSPLPVGQIDSLGLAYATYRLVYTPGLLTAIYGTKIASANLAAAGGYQDLDTDGCQWTPASIAFYSANPASPDPAFAERNFYLPQGAVDPWGNVSLVGYDPHKLLVIQTTDAAVNVIQAVPQYRVLAPWLVTDANLNRTGVRYDPLGMVVATAAMGKLLPDGTDEGDHLDTSTAEPAAGDDPTTTLDYNLAAYQTWAANPNRDPDHPVPAWAHTRARVRHQDPQTSWLETYTYTDGHGRVALTKAQAEAGDAPLRDPSSGQLLRNPDGSLMFGHTDTRWTGTGRVVHDNKGNPVKAYEPFFDSSPVYDDETDLVEWGVTAITRYDPLSRAYRVDNPDGTYRTVEWDAWRQVSSDENDTVLTSAWYAARLQDPPGSDGADAADKAYACRGTPGVADLDTLGRTFRTVADNGTDGTYPSQVTLDIQGHVRATTDAFGAVDAAPGDRGRTVLTQDYDLVGAEIHRVSLDAGERWVLPDAAGQHLLGWDGFGRQISADYDALRRPTGLHVTLPGATSGRLAEQVVYGETLTLATAQAKNLRGAVYQHCDEAGIATTVQRDFDGHVTTATRQLLSDFSGDIDWSTGQPLDNDVFTTAKAYDALGRPVSVTTPDGSVTSQVFNKRSLLSAVTVAPPGAAAAGYVTSISYDARGQRQNLIYGNGAVTDYTYDPDTFRLVTLTTTRQAGLGPLQALTYVYDAVGNITRLHDAAQQTIFFNNQIVTPDADYTYDAIYRLTKAVGREHRGQTGQPQTTWNDGPRIDVPLPTDGQAMRPYTETYDYDAVGNFQTVVHTGDNGNWTRTYTYDQPTSPPASNRLTSTTVGSVTDNYSYDADGNIIEMPHLTLMAWNWKDQLHATSQAASTTGPPPYATYYRYDASGQRVRKVSATPGGIAQQRVYLDGYEVYREYSSTGSVTLERQSLHVGDSDRLICLIETTVGSGRVDRYQLGNHLGSAILEVDDNAAVLTYEEYYPYGSTSYQTGTSAAEVSLKRYRYTGKERDEESGFSYHGARYYAPWLGRWTACDPMVTSAGISAYTYANNNPVRFSDPGGAQAMPSPELLAINSMPPSLRAFVGVFYGAGQALAGAGSAVFWSSYAMSLDWQFRLGIKSKEDFPNEYKLMNAVRHRYAEGFLKAASGLSGLTEIAGEGIHQQVKETVEAARRGDVWGSATALGGLTVSTGGLADTASAALGTSPPPPAPQLAMTTEGAAVPIADTLAGTGPLVPSPPNVMMSAATRKAPDKRFYNEQERLSKFYGEKAQGKGTIPREIEIWRERFLASGERFLEKVEGVRFDAANVIERILVEWTTPNQIAITAPGTGKWNQIIRRVGVFQEARLEGFRLYGWSQETQGFIGDVTDWQQLTTKYEHWNWPKD
jgi:RHS repeat-associated protein